MRPYRDHERDARLAALYRSGHYTLEAIADMEAERTGYRMTRERVRQLVRREGVTPRESADARYRARTREATCVNCGKRWRVSTSSRARFCSRPCWRVRYSRAGMYTEAALLAHLQTLAKKLGRTPSIRDVNAHKPPMHTTYCQHFGTMARAQELADLTPNKRGGYNPRVPK